MLSPADFSDLPMWLITVLILVLVLIVGFFLAGTYSEIKQMVAAVNGIRVELATVATELSNTKDSHEKLERKVDDIAKDMQRKV